MLYHFLGQVEVLQPPTSLDFVAPGEQHDMLPAAPNLYRLREPPPCGFDSLDSGYELTGQLCPEDDAFGGDGQVQHVVALRLRLLPAPSAPTDLLFCMLRNVSAVDVIAGLRCPWFYFEARCSCVAITCRTQPSHLTKSLAKAVLLPSLAWVTRMHHRVN